MKLNGYIFVAFFSFAFAASAQLPGKSDKSFLYRQEWVGMGTLQTNGWGFGIRYGKQKSAEVKRLFNLDFATVKHDKETRVINILADEAKGYVFGKVNSFVVLRPQYGQRHVLFKKKRESGVELGYIWNAGPTLGLLKPIYLDICRQNSGPGGCIPTVERYDPELHDIYDIYGKAPGTKGLGETKLKPGLGGKLALYFEWSTLEDGIKALEIGSTIDVFPQRIEIMAGENNNSFLYQSFYISFVFGKKLF